MILAEYDQERHIKNEKQNSYWKGHEDGRIEGYAAGEREESIKSAIQIYRRLSWSDADICKTLAEEYTLTEEEVKVICKNANKIM